MIRSHDVFDTLVARRLPPSELLEILAESHHDDFIRDRKVADNGQRSLPEIYQHMLDQGQIRQPTISHTVQSLVEDECRLERDNLYPIGENMDRVQDGDILVSDMYIPGSEILEMVRACGLTKQVTIYQSNGDKASGRFWKGLMEAGVELEYHIGDNHNSDYIQPGLFGFKSIHFDRLSKPLMIEQYLVGTRLTSIARLVREVTSRECSVGYPAAYTIAAQLNLPWLLVVCEMIRRRNQVKSQPLTFLGRDCQLMCEIWNAFYGPWNMVGHYLPFSRKVALENPPEASFYLHTQAPKDSLLIDISSTGRTWERLTQGARHEVLVVIHSDQYHYSKEKPVLPTTFSSLTKNSDVGPSNILLEIFNCGDHGRLDKLEMVGGVPIATFATPELHPDLIRAIHRPVAMAVDLSRYYAHDINYELASLTDAELLQVFKDLKNTICAQIKVLQVLNDYVAKDEAYTQECRAL
jgi:hypothetical protein